MGSIFASGGKTITWFSIVDNVGLSQPDRDTSLPEIRDKMAVARAH